MGRLVVQASIADDQVRSRPRGCLYDFIVGVEMREQQRSIAIAAHHQFNTFARGRVVGADQHKLGKRFLHRAPHPSSSSCSLKGLTNPARSISATGFRTPKGSAPAVADSFDVSSA